ncbi:MAG: hypothetical protein ACJ75B_05955 [Flavisolibacter sp.]
MRYRLLALPANLILILSFQARAQSDSLLYPEEKHFKNIQQLTFGADNA